MTYIQDKTHCHVEKKQLRILPCINQQLEARLPSWRPSQQENLTTDWNDTPNKFRKKDSKTRNPCYHATLTTIHENKWRQVYPWDLQEKAVDNQPNQCPESQFWSADDGVRSWEDLWSGNFATELKIMRRSRFTWLIESAKDLSCTWPPKSMDGLIRNVVCSENYKVSNVWKSRKFKKFKEACITLGLCNILVSRFALHCINSCLFNIPTHASPSKPFQMTFQMHHR